MYKGLARTYCFLLQGEKGVTSAETSHTTISRLYVPYEVTANGNYFTGLCNEK
jgi:hypothetical protein